MPRCSPAVTTLSRGIILADEVGLGKTIEAGLVISRRWVDLRRLIIVTANLRNIDKTSTAIAKTLKNALSHIDLINQLEVKLHQQVEEHTLFATKWELK